MFEAKKIQTNWSQRSSCDVGSLLHAFFHVELPVHSKSCAGHGVWLEESDSEVSSPRKPRHDVGQTARGAGGHPQMTIGSSESNGCRDLNQSKLIENRNPVGKCVDNFLIPSFGTCWRTQGYEGQVATQTCNQHERDELRSVFSCRRAGMFHSWSCGIRSLIATML